MKYSEEKQKEIFDGIICKLLENQSLRSAIKESGISTSTFFVWLNDEKYPERAKQYARAHEIRAEIMADEILEIADDGKNDLMTIVKGDQEYELENKEVTNRSRLRVDARKWLMSKKLPKVYGDSLKLSGDADAPLEMKMKVEIVSGAIPIKTRESEE